jgi:hypothetical protein
MNQELKTIKLIRNGQQYVLPCDRALTSVRPPQGGKIKRGNEKMTTTIENKTEIVKKEVEYQKAGWINKSKSGQALTFKIGERFYSVPISSVKDLLSSDKSGVTFSEVISKA